MAEPCALGLWLGLATGRHTSTSYLCLIGATTVKHLSRFSVFLGCPLSHNDDNSGARSSARETLQESGIFPIPWFSPEQ
jgi:hypothetical protein